jgi:hypothetical protein
MQAEPVQPITLPDLKSSAERRGLPLVKSIAHIHARIMPFGRNEEYIECLSRSLVRTGARSSIVYDELRGTLPQSLSNSIKVQGLASRRRVRGLVDRVQHAISAIGPDLVYVHEIFDGRILRALDTRRRPYGILWHVHDHYPTCLTGLRANTGRDSVCLEPLSTKCLSKIGAGSCTTEMPASSYSYFDLAARIELLRSARYADAVIVASELMKRLLVSNNPDIANRVHLVPYSAGGRTAPAGESESLVDVIRRVRRAPRH